jgi:hypothetical protein
MSEEWRALLLALSEEWFTRHVRTSRFEVLKSLVMQSTIFWDIKPCSPLKVKRRFGRTYRLHPQVVIISRERYKSSVCHLLSRWFLARVILRPWSCMRYVPPKRRLTFKGIHGVISQKILVFIAYSFHIRTRPRYTYWTEMWLHSVTLAFAFHIKCLMPQ